MSKLISLPKPIILMIIKESDNFYNLMRTNKFLNNLIKNNPYLFKDFVGDYFLDFDINQIDYYIRFLKNASDCRINNDEHLFFENIDGAIVNVKEKKILFLDNLVFKEFNTTEECDIIMHDCSIKYINIKANYLSISDIIYPIKSIHTNENVDPHFINIRCKTCKIYNVKCVSFSFDVDIIKSLVLLECQYVLVNFININGKTIYMTEDGKKIKMYKFPLLIDNLEVKFEIN